MNKKTRFEDIEKWRQATSQNLQATNPFLFDSLQSKYRCPSIPSDSGMIITTILNNLLVTKVLLPFFENMFYPPMSNPCEFVLSRRFGQIMLGIWRNQASNCEIHRVIQLIRLGTHKAYLELSRIVCHVHHVFYPISISLLLDTHPPSPRALRLCAQHGGIHVVKSWHKKFH